MIYYHSTNQLTDRDAAIERYYATSSSVAPIIVRGSLEVVDTDRITYLVSDGLKRTEAPGVPYHVGVTHDALGAERITCDCLTGGNDCGHIGAVLVERAAQQALEDIRAARAACAS